MILVNRVLPMRNFALLIVTLVLAAAVWAHTSNEQPQPVSSGYDAQRAAKAGADEYGMKPYVMAFLKKGPNRDRSKAESEKLQRAHLDNIKRLADEGKLVLAGPFLNDGDIRGIYIFNVASVDEAKVLTETDPAIQAGSLVMELVPWYGTAALTEVNHIHKFMAKKKI